MYNQPRRLEERRSVGLQGHRVGEVLDGTGEVIPFGTGQAAKLVKRGRRLATGN